MNNQTEQPTNQKPIDILLVEDNEADIKITLRAFEKAKLKNNIHVVHDGQQALDYIYHQGAFAQKEKFPRPDIILLDINLPKVDGFEVLKRLKEDSEYRSIPTIMLTSSRRDEDIIKSFGDGAASYIPKPVNYDDFVNVVDSFNFYWTIVNKLPKRS